MDQKSRWQLKGQAQDFYNNPLELTKVYKGEKIHISRVSQLLDQELLLALALHTYILISQHHHLRDKALHIDIFVGGEQITSKPELRETRQKDGVV